MLKFEINYLVLDYLVLASLFLPSVSFPIYILLLAAILDYLIGDPGGWLHPVQVMGWIIQNYTNLALEFCHPGWQRRLAGLLLGWLLIVGSGLFGWLIISGCSIIHPLLGSLMEVVLLASCFAGKSLRVAVQDVLKPLEAGDIIKARSRLSLYVGRDTDNLSQSEILRALLETVAENAVDGVTAPLFYAIVGFFTPLGAIPLALAYKAASTLDSMIGYLREPYTDLGWFSAQLEDRLTWIPCRLTVITLSLVSGKLQQVWRICLRDGIKDPSPNSGWSEAAYAGILGVQLGGINTYKGVVTEKPLLGDAIEIISVAKINQALTLTSDCFVVWLAIAIFADTLI
ncbi:MAG: adenosylcobinamide-phosphate synthase CbiB [Waterburya sp.]